MADAVLRCPKCGAGMVTFQRGGIVFEECSRCRGVFLGRGELDRLMWRGTSHTPAVCGHPAGISYEGRHRRA
ncbi:zf-TFIIB domain-containing protein [Actinoallomurus sp. NPDC052308]|uniref:TFIIB-type zinc ribbon-containing protein n=1 Tax=Actinoallomurus sp. NPDC052308 TaxID=3155530 RepID=UPI00344A690C